MWISNMRFSIIIPVYNVEPYLRQSLDSVLGQTFGDWEAVCVNDGSTDGSAAILEEYAVRDLRIKVITQVNGGLSAARNTGLRESKGEYVLFVDSDDWIEPDTLSCISKCLNGEDMLCFGGWQGDQMEIPVAESRLNGWDYYNRHALEHHVFPFVCVVLRCYRRHFLLDNSLTFKEGILHEDNHFTPRACLAAKCVSVIPDALYHYRVRPGSIMTTRSLRSRQDMIRIANELSDLFYHEEGIDKTVVFRALTHHYQAAFAGATNEEDQQLLPLVNWKSFHHVSRTKFRHFVNYLLIRFHPSWYRYANDNASKQ